MKQKNWEKEFDKLFPFKNNIALNNLFVDVKLYIRQLLRDARQEEREKIQNKIDKNYKGRDITIYELGDWIQSLSSKNPYD